MQHGQVIDIAAATAAIKNRKYHDQTVSKVKDEREKLSEQLCELGFTVPRSFSNFVLAQNPQAADIYNKLMQHDIYVRYFNLPGLEDKLRITVGTAEQTNRLMAALREILSQ